VATHAPVRPEFGRQSTGGSTSIRLGYDAIRRAAAIARELLIAAGAKALGTSAAECRAEHGKVIGKTGEKRFGELALAASRLPKPESPKLRDKLALGTPTRRLDSFDKVTGRARYGIDVVVEGMLLGKVLHSPGLGGTVRSVDDSKARAVPGVREVVKLDTGVCVLADNTWSAHKGRAALAVQWQEPHRSLSNASIDATLRKAVKRGAVLHEQGNVSKAGGTGQTVVEAEYSVPYLAHAPMEPLSCTVKLTAESCDVWTSTQSPSGVVDAVAKITGLSPEKIAVHSQYLGGGFGRRSQTDYVEEAVHAARKSGKVVKLIWDREDDIRGYQYRPVGFNRLKGVIDSGKLVALEHHIASPSILKQMSSMKPVIDPTSVDGVIKYCPAALKVTCADVDLPCPTWFWRSVGHSQNGFVTEGFMGELARAAGVDPVDFRLSTPIQKIGEGGLQDNPRLKKVLEVVAERAGWGSRPPEGVARGVGISESFGSFTAQVVEASIDKGRPRVHRVVCAIDCGQVINPLTVQAQVESGIVYGLSAALYGRIDFEAGRVSQGNFDRYRVVRMREMPKIETHIVESSEAHGGVGEPATGPIAGALAEALLALDGAPRRALPLVRSA
jgi:isoquinoline 1-oxidoreductase beta subunit